MSLLSGQYILSSLNSELHEEKEDDLLLDEKYFVPSGHPDSPDTQELFRSSVVPSDEPKVSSAVDGAKLNSDDLSGMKNSPKLEDDTAHGFFTNKYGCHIIGRIDDFTALRE
ncbi:myomegalin-like [Marmota monax]|uniref:myomegalin-like n=1 Tax=Marmota monax TaxID=9995 RepID=UPI0026F1F38E|nr:myomegalin-like [Marmota monax]